LGGGNSGKNGVKFCHEVFTINFFSSMEFFVPRQKENVTFNFHLIFLTRSRNLGFSIKLGNKSLGVCLDRSRLRMLTRDICSGKRRRKQVARPQGEARRLCAPQTPDKTRRRGPCINEASWKHIRDGSIRGDGYKHGGHAYVVILFAITINILHGWLVGPGNLKFSFALRSRVTSVCGKYYC